MLRVLRYRAMSDGDPDPVVPHRKACKRFNTPGHSHYLTFSCFQRKPFLNRDRTRQWLVDAINLARQNHQFDLWAYVFMPEHSHLLIFPTQDIYSISDILSTIKQSVGKRAISFVRDQAPDFLEQMTDRQPNGTSAIRFWQRGGGYDRNLWNPRDIWEKIDYIHNNPVKRKLCVAPQDWQWSSAAAYAGSRAGPLSIDLHSVPAKP
jgi:putative transposase